MANIRQLVNFRLDDRRYALSLTTVERVVRSAELTPLPGSPEIILGVLNVHGNLMPAVRIRQRFNLPSRPPSINDHFVIARTSRRAVILPVDAALGVLEYPEDRIVDSAAVAPRLEYVSGILKLEDGLILIHDLDTFLSFDEEEVLDKAMKEYQAPSTPKDKETRSRQ